MSGQLCVAPHAPHLHPEEGSSWLLGTASLQSREALLPAWQSFHRKHPVGQFSAMPSPTLGERRETRRVGSVLPGSRLQLLCLSRSLVHGPVARAGGVRPGSGHFLSLAFQPLLFTEGWAG